MVCFSSQQLNTPSERVSLKGQRTISQGTEYCDGEVLYAHWLAVVCQAIVPDEVKITHELCLALVPSTFDVSQHRA